MQELGCLLEETARALHRAGEEHSPENTLRQTESRGSDRFLGGNAEILMKIHNSQARWGQGFA